MSPTTSQARSPFQLVVACMIMALAGCHSPGNDPAPGAVPTGQDPSLDLYRVVRSHRDAHALVKPAPSTDRQRQALVWGLVGSAAGVQQMPPVPSVLLEQALEGLNLEVLDHVPGKRDREELVLSFINADLMATDPHARYLPPPQVETLDRRLSLFDEGLGIAVVQESTGAITVQDVSPGSPASQVAHLGPGSVLLRVRPEGLAWSAPQTAEQWSAALSGPPGTRVGLEWLDTSGQKRSVAIERTWWSIESQRTTARIVDTPAGRLGVVSMPAFYDRGDEVGTGPDLDAAIIHLRRKHAQVMVLDLRGNRGGQWSTVMDAASLVMPGQRLANAVGLLPRPIPVDVRSPANAWTGPVWVWVDRHTASGAEILAGALREGAGACIVGERTFGKATMQERIDIKPPFGGQLLVSTVMYAWPSGNTAQWSGVEPDMWMSDPALQDQAGERAYPSALVPSPPRPARATTIYPGSALDDGSWISASIDTPKCPRQ